MVEIQQWLDESCRDILDESDFTLSAKTQLIYPSGPQTAVDGHPHRWLVVEELLSLVEGHVERLERIFRTGSRWFGGLGDIPSFTSFGRNQRIFFMNY